MIKKVRLLIHNLWQDPRLQCWHLISNFINERTSTVRLSFTLTEPPLSVHCLSRLFLLICNLLLFPWPLFIPSLPTHVPSHFYVSPVGSFQSASSKVLSYLLSPFCCVYKPTSFRIHPLSLPRCRIPSPRIPYTILVTPPAILLVTTMFTLTYTSLLCLPPFLVHPGTSGTILDEKK